MSIKFDKIIDMSYANIESFRKYYPTYALIAVMDGCAWCTRTVPLVEQAIIQGPQDIPVLRVVYNKDKSIAIKEKINGFPTIRLYSLNKTSKKFDHEEYNGDRSVDSFVQFFKKNQHIK